jgi:predicted ATPase
MEWAMTAATPLFGRELETQVLAGLLDNLRRRGGSLVVRGEPGIGKSALLREASARARPRDAGSDRRRRAV